jgi:GNAT superfamily N-acetyltransferase
MTGAEYVLLTWIGVGRFHRGKGYGSKMLKRICDEADQEGVTLIASVQPDPGALTEHQLFSWYLRYGFERWQGGVKREPQINLQ